jgi:hypothetical protein
VTKRPGSSKRSEVAVSSFQSRSFICQSCSDRQNRSRPATSRAKVNSSSPGLHRRPGAELRAACEFVGEPYDPGLLSGLDVEEARVAHWEGSSLLYSAITTTTKNWRDYLSEADARRVEELLGPELARFGYARAAR